MNIETIRHEALALAPQVRAQLAEQLLSSLDTLTETEIEQLWLQDTERRADELGKDSDQLISADAVHQETLALLK